MKWSLAKLVCWSEPASYAHHARFAPFAGERSMSSLPGSREDPPRPLRILAAVDSQGASVGFSAALVIL